jgi:hypothetical protein
MGFRPRRDPGSVSDLVERDLGGPLKTCPGAQRGDSADVSLEICSGVQSHYMETGGRARGVRAQGRSQHDGPRKGHDAPTRTSKPRAPVGKNGPVAVTSLPLISQLTIREAVDAGSYARGKEYHRLGRVKRLEWRPDQKRLVGTVRGSHSEPYATSVWLAEDVSGSEVSASSCSCPIGGHCKHVVASLLAYHERAVADPLPGFPDPPTRAQTNRSPAPRPSPSRPKPPPLPAWKTALGALTRGVDGPQSSTPPARSSYTPLGLQFRVDGLKQATEAGRNRGRSPHQARGPARAAGSRGGWSGGYTVGWIRTHGHSPFDRDHRMVSELGSCGPPNG